MTRADIRLQAWFLSAFVTRVIKAPPLELTTRQVAEPELVTVPTRHGPVRCFITRGAADTPLAQHTGAPPVHINIHGGAFLIGAPRQDDHLVRAMAGEAGATVVNVDYSTAPKARYPQAHQECYDVLDWVRRSGSTMGWDDQRVSIGGGSAGGNLALGALELARQAGDSAVRTCILVVPSVDQTIAPEQYSSPMPPGAGRAARPFVSPRLVRVMQETYFTDASRRAEPLASPLLGDEEIASLPPLLVIAAEQDSLRPQIEQLVTKARSKSVPVTYQCFAGVDHDFPVRPKAGTEPALRELANLMCTHLIKHLA
ncbi:MAG: alpha/beta hydrolase [Actinobacteria bacterium]|nr:alpha/beta hydrolase [Actinomycetota bacterium]